MSCVKPIKAWRSGLGEIVFTQSRSKSGISFQLPCGQCIGCRVGRAQEWGLRCMHEARMWRHNYFVTLTYADEFLPPGGSLSKRDVQLFMKRLRKARNSSVSNPVRFFLGGEYGDINGRPHYHALLFNCDFPDKKFLKSGKEGHLYCSEELEHLWSVDGVPLGHCSIGAVTLKSAIYCAKYALKKVNGDSAEDHYTVYDVDGVCHYRTPEFAVMSRRPGIGAGYYEKYGEEARTHDNVIVEGRKSGLPRYYDDLGKRKLVAVHDEAALICLCQLCKNKRRRKRQSVLNRFDNTPARLRVKEVLMLEAAKRKERKL